LSLETPGFVASSTITKVDELLTITTREKQSFRSVELMLPLEELELTDEDLESEPERRFDLKEKAEKFENLNIVACVALTFNERNGLGYGWMVLDQEVYEEENKR
jgi:hypothetical protein